MCSVVPFTALRRLVDSSVLEIQVKPKLPGTRQVLAGRLTEKAAGQIAIRLRQVHAVEQVEHVCSEFEGKTFPFHHLREFCIDVGQTGANEGVSAQIALLSECGDGES